LNLLLIATYSNKTKAEVLNKKGLYSSGYYQLPVKLRVIAEPQQ